ncbi:hypothetical protein E3N88_13431 [Mikania micrantha]|uniref:Uncharacterized protein n=1 Tax=Mikania micrantha TaxID=192012 RepID=A0A5N6PA71_9ASTR|nr:hypothetical protein E3N88_13431 [Mikania micrantha]
MTSEEAFDTFSLSDLHIYSDPSCSYKEEQDNGSSFSSFRFKITGPLPPEEIVFFSDRKPHHHKPQKSSSPVQDHGRKSGGRRRNSRRGFLMSPARMDVFDLQARGFPPVIVPVNVDGVEEVTVRRKRGNWVGKLIKTCIPVF